MKQKKMYTLLEAFSLVRRNGKMIKAELIKSHGHYLDETDLRAIEYAIELAASDPQYAADYLKRQDTIVREAAVVSIIVALKIEG